MVGRTVSIALVAASLLLGLSRSAEADRHRYRWRHYPSYSSRLYPSVWVYPSRVHYSAVRSHLRRYRLRTFYPFTGYSVFSPAGSYPVHRYYGGSVLYDPWYPPEEYIIVTPSRSRFWHRRFEQERRLDWRQERFEDRLGDRWGRFREADERWYDR